MPLDFKVDLSNKIEQLQISSGNSTQAPLADINAHIETPSIPEVPHLKDSQRLSELIKTLNPKP